MAYFDSQRSRILRAISNLTILLERGGKKVDLYNQLNLAVTAFSQMKDDFYRMNESLVDLSILRKTYNFAGVPATKHATDIELDHAISRLRNVFREIESGIRAVAQILKDVEDRIREERLSIRDLTQTIERIRWILGDLEHRLEEWARALQDAERIREYIRKKGNIKPLKEADKLLGRKSQDPDLQFYSGDIPWIDTKTGKSGKKNPVRDWLSGK